tara:strand:- start:510 stop:791 length:282 start_codon:yes stop_codon:yes gene_type:complete
MRVLLVIFLLLFQSCSQTFTPSPIPPDIENPNSSTIPEFKDVDKDKDSFISKEEYNYISSPKYDRQGPVLWFSIIILFVCVFSVVLSYFISKK